jgi:hypothetical protein
MQWTFSVNRQYSVAAITLLAAGVVCLPGCSKAPSGTQYLRTTYDFLVRYCTNDAVSAEAALLEWEAYAIQGHKAKVWRIKFDQEFAAIYGRLYLVERHLGKMEEAKMYFQKCVEWCHRMNMRERRPLLSDDEIRVWLEERIDRDWPSKWRQRRSASSSPARSSTRPAPAPCSTTTRGGWCPTQA